MREKALTSMDKPNRAAAQFTAAIHRFEQGDLRGAEALFKDLLRKNPKSAPCWHILGLIEQQRGHDRKALELLDRAIALDPNDAAAHSNRGNLLAAMGQPEAALASFDRALALRPDLAQVLCNRGNILHSLGRHAEALASYNAAIAADPGLAQVYNNQGNTLAALGRAEDAVASFTQAIARNPQYAEALYNRANILLALRRAAEALRDYDRALTLQPELPEALCNRGNALQALRRFQDAVASYDRALAIRADYTDALNSRGNALKALGRNDDALASYARAFAARPADPEALSNRGHLFQEIADPDAALAEYGRALAIDPAHSPALQGRALILLGRGDYVAGWDAYEERWRYQTFMADGPTALPALGIRPARADLVGRNIALMREQGIGDEVMFASILPDLQNDARHVTYACEPRLARLFAHSFSAITFTDPATFDGTKYDAVFGIGSLGHAYRQHRAAFPATPYLAPSPAIAAAWAARLGPRDGRLRVGISWRGGTADTRAEQRSLTLAQCQPLFALPNCDFVSLQYGEVADEIAAFNASLTCPIRHFPRAETEDFEDLAGLIAALDLVVSVQNSVVHLCGALGKECLALLPANAEWRYGIAGDRMAWYDSVRLFRRAPAGDWAAVVEQVAAIPRARKG